MQLQRFFSQKYHVLSLLVIISVVKFTSTYYIKRSTPEPCSYVVVMDAGSTKTKAFIFYFTRSFDDNRVLGSKTLKPALSYYGNKPAKLNQLQAGLRSLVAYAKKKIPENCVAQTNIVLKATAGLRQLPQNQAERILSTVREVLSKCGFRFEYKFVGMLSGAEEGIYAWLGGNILLGKINEPHESWNGILELGGGSTQVAFIPDSNVPNSNIRDFSAIGETVKLYSKSYPKGLNNARMYMLEVDDGCKKIGQCGDRVYKSPCFNPRYRGSFKFGPARFSVSGAPLPDGVTDRFQYCYDKAQAYVQDVKAVRELFGDKKFLAIAGFYYAINNANIMRPDTRSDRYELSLQQIKNLAIKNCRSPAENDSEGYFHSYVCLDLTYIIALLKNGYQFTENDKFTVSLKMEGKKLGWPIGIGMYYRKV